MKKERHGEKRGGGKKKISVNKGLLAGLFGGALLGVFTGTVFHDIPLHIGFGMILGMAITIDISARFRRGKEESEESNGGRR